MTDFPVIDVHTHLAYHKIFPDRFLDEVTNDIFSDGGFDETFRKQFFKSFLSDQNGDSAVKLMDKAGVEKSVLLIADFGYALGEAELSIEEIFELHRSVMERHPDRFLVFGGLDPRRGQQGVDLFRKGIEEYHFHGLKLYPPCGFELDDERLFPYYEICDHYRLPVLSHTGPSLESMITEKAYPSSAEFVLNKFKNLRFILGHAGARDYKNSLDLLSKYENAYVDISTFNVVDETEFKHYLEQFMTQSPKQVLFGSDHPIFAMSQSIDGLIKTLQAYSFLNETQLKQLLHDNVSTILNASRLAKAAY